MKQRRFNIKKDDIEVMVDFAKEGSESYSCEVVSKVVNGKIEVLSARTLGKAKKWKNYNINGYLADFYGCVDEE